MSGNRAEVFGGVDTHRDVHVAAVVDTACRILGTMPFPTDALGYERMVSVPRAPGTGRNRGYGQLRRRSHPLPAHPSQHAQHPVTA